MATQYQIPITYVISASAVKPSQGLSPLQLSTILILTDEQPITTQAQDYIISRTSSSVTSTYGTNSETAGLVNTIFSQQPNILANNGYVIVAPFIQNYTPEPTPATSGTLTTPNLAANIANFSTVTDGILSLTIDGANTELTELNFTNVSNLTDIAAVIQSKLTTATVTVNGDNQIVFASKTTGTSSTVTINDSSDTGTDLYDSSYLNGANATAVTGAAEIVNPARKENYAEAINRLKAQVYFEGIITTRDITDDEAIQASNQVQSYQDRILFLPKSNLEALQAGGIFETLQNNTFTKLLFYSLGATTEGAKQNARNFAAAYASRGFAVNYNGSNTTLTMNLKTLSNVSADTNISETVLSQCEALGVDCYPSIEGLAKVISNRQGGQYFDEVSNQIWFVSTIQRTVFNLLATTGGKIPQTERGLQIIDKGIRQVCNQAVTNEYLAPGTWNSPDTFGNYDDFMRNISEFGFYYYHTPISEQLQAEREQRKAPVYSIAGKTAGAIHSANILIYIEP